VCSYCSDIWLIQRGGLLPEALNLNVLSHKYMIKRILMAAIAAAATFMPVAAEVQPGTGSLLETIDSNGILVTINHEECATGTYNGQYRWLGFQREMRLCPGTTVDARDHETVRHETIHAIQHCINVARGTSTDTPIVDDPEQFKSFVIENLSQQDIDWIMANYDQSQWLTELEAFAGANAFTSTELEELFLKACVAQ